MTNVESATATQLSSCSQSKETKLQEQIFGNTDDNDNNENNDNDNDNDNNEDNNDNDNHDNGNNNDDDQDNDYDADDKCGQCNGDPVIKLLRLKQKQVVCWEENCESTFLATMYCNDDEDADNGDDDGDADDKYGKYMQWRPSYQCALSQSKTKSSVEKIVRAKFCCSFKFT